MTAGILRWLSLHHAALAGLDVALLLLIVFYVLIFVIGWKKTKF